MGQNPGALPARPPAFAGGRGWFWRAAGRSYLRLGGWRIEGALPEVPKCVTIVAPHTSNWDFLLGVALLFALDLRVSWLGKHALFRRPFDGFLRWLGGIPVDRRVRSGVVGACAEAFAEAPSLMLALSPEGTRKGPGGWRTGFYWIAVAAGVPVFPVAFDFDRHRILFLPLFTPTGDLDQDLPKIQALFEGVRGLKDRRRN
ncbi:MAG: lysophospholipid acyltransferase family protein [Acidobacteria bacterium]|nr:lysophospholipid acyltransferase family protein [Acidobacteriota bacterium]